MEKINVAELLKDCPKGMELDCVLNDNVTFECILDGNCYPIQIQTPEGDMRLSQYGCMSLSRHAKCVIFPKGKTTWEGFQRPFKDGDILSYQCAGFRNRTIYIYMHHPAMNTSYYVALGGDLNFMVSHWDVCALNGNNTTARFATEEEKQKLFQAIKENGYKWNAETKTLEKLIEPKFKVGDRIKHKNGYLGVSILKINADCYTVKDFIGDQITIDFTHQDNYELVPNKFDITTLKPFDKVLVRTKNFTPVWTIDFYDGYQPNIGGSFTPFGVTGGKYFQQCIPYEGNQHLLGTTDDCDEYFKTWK